MLGVDSLFMKVQAQWERASVKPESASGVVKVNLPSSRGFAANDPNVHQSCSDVLLRRHVGVVFVHNDHLGTPIILTNQSQDKVWEATYTPFGKATITNEIVENNLRGIGQHYDEETGLHYVWWRYLDPELGRFTQSDFIGLGDGPNTYAYVGNNPLIYIDPDGQSKKKLAEFILSVVLTIGGDGNGDGKPGGSPGRRDPTPNEQVQQDQKKKPKKKKGFGKKQGGFASPELLIGSITVIGWMFGDGLACSSLDCDGDGLNDHTGQPMFSEPDPCIKP